MSVHWVALTPVAGSSVLPLAAEVGGTPGPAGGVLVSGGAVVTGAVDVD
jgi:hypothetical protein